MNSRLRVAVSALIFAVLGCLIDAAPAAAQNGAIAGTVTHSGTAAPLSGVPIWIFNASGAFVQAASTNVSGQYSVSLPAGSYRVRTAASSVSLNFADELFDNLACVGFCDVTGGTAVVVTAGATHGQVDFALAPGGSVTGTVTNSANAAPLSGIRIDVYTASGDFVGSGMTNGAGTFTVAALATGTYVARTALTGSQNYLAEGYDNIDCSSFCSPDSLTPIGVTAGSIATHVDFALTPGATMSGTVTASGGGPLANVQVAVRSANGLLQVGFAATDGTGAWSVNRLPVGSYVVQASAPQGVNYIDELYDDIPCLACDPATGTTVQVVTPGSTVSGINFALSPGGTITGTVTATGSGTAVNNAGIAVYTSGGSLAGFASTNSSGAYTITGLPTASYYIRTFASSLNLIDEVYNNVPCVPCDVTTSGTAVSVTAGSSTSGINFSLAQGGQLSGVVTDAVSHEPLEDVEIDVFAADGTFLDNTYTDGSGIYTLKGLPTGSYFVSAFFDNSSSPLDYVPQLYLNKPFPEPLNFSTVGGEDFDDLPPLINVTAGDSVNVTAGSTTNGVSFELTPGGRVTGHITDASTGAPLENVLVKVYTTTGTFVAAGYSDSAGNYEVRGVATGSYVMRASATTSLNYVPELYNDQACVACDLSTGTPISVTTGATTPGIDFALAPNLVQNGTFGAGTTGWKLFGAPNDTYMTWNTTGGSFNLRRAPQPAGTPVSQGLVFQDTGIAVPINTPVVAQFDLANTASKIMIMRVLLVGNSANFGLDFAACTFALPNDGLFRTYQMKAHSTTAWPNAAVYFYATQIDPNGGDYYYKVDNVSVARAPGQSLERTECIDPLAPGTTAGADSANLLVNGDFTAGMANWGEDGAIVRRDPMVGGVYEAYRTAAFRPPVVLQQTNPTLQPGGMLPLGQRLTLTLRLGNTLPSRARALVLVNDNDFSSFAACAFWLGPNQPLSTFAMQIYTSEAWQNPAVSVYPSSGAVSPGWLQLDDVVLQKTPGTSTTGSVCLEGSEASALMALNGFGGGAFGTLMAAVAPPADEADAPSRPGDDGSPSSAGGLASAGASSPLDEPLGSPDGTWTKDGDEWTTTARGDAETPHVLRWLAPIDLAAMPEAHLTFESQLSATDSQAEVQVSLDDGRTWMTIALLGQADTWDTVDVDLSAFHGSVIHVRFAFEGAGPAAGAAADAWRVRDVQLEVASTQVAHRRPVAVRTGAHQ